ncbi:chain length determinant protein tyrosine kinase EpsG [Dechloromonas denitrificans]|uniref:chain length determinant protein tyrosine kinase EpsG n=1 Tax=Dechloromonas denitrificans TaxID=281362 RepID=UPI001CF846D6|nr:chain length determinant protein tyrosine kinase EpsG [Dechloromonas denitrificans]
MSERAMNFAQPSETIITRAAQHHGLASRSIGTILMDAGRLSTDAAESIIKLQKEGGLRFGDAAIQLGLLTEADVRYALSHQFEYPYLMPGDTSLSEEVVAAYKPFSPIVEKLRALRSQLMLRWFDGESGNKMLAVTSPERGEGRSYIAANLAVVFSQLGERTLLIDADLRHPRQHEIFKLGNRNGLSAVLAARTGMDEAIVRIPDLLGLSVMPAGAIPPNPQELFNRPQFLTLLESAQRQFDVILFDTSIGGAYADAQMIASRAGGAIVLSRKDVTQAARLRELTDSLRHSGATVVGSVLNGN